MSEESPLRCKKCSGTEEMFGCPRGFCAKCCQIGECEDCEKQDDCEVCQIREDPDVEDAFEPDNIGEIDEEYPDYENMDREDW